MRKILIIKIGALTSKPYSFKSRPWELKHIETLDLHDTLCSNIKISYKGSEIWRIRPSLNENINEEWISDKARFAFDGLNRWRYITPLYKSKKGFIQSSWKRIFKKLNLDLKEKNINHIEAFTGPYIGIKQSFLIKKTLNKIGSVNINTTNFTNDFFEINIINKKKKFKNPIVYIFNNINLRLENPVLNLYFRKYSKKSNVNIYFIGPSYNTTIYMKNISQNSNSLIKILKGKHKLCSIINKIRPVYINLLISKNDDLKINSSFSTLSGIPFKINVLSEYPGQISSSFIGLNSYEKKKNKLNILKYLYNTENNKVDSLITIFQGSQNDVLIEDIDYILPTTNFIEESDLFINCFGLKQETNTLPCILDNVKNNEDTIYILFKLCFGIKANKENLHLFTNKYKKSPLFVVRKSFPPYLIKNKSYNKQNTNYYLTNSTLRASKTMQNSSKTFYNNKYNYIWK